MNNVTNKSKNLPNCQSTALSQELDVLIFNNEQLREFLIVIKRSDIDGNHQTEESNHQNWIDSVGSNHQIEKSNHQNDINALKSNYQTEESNYQSAKNGNHQNKVRTRLTKEQEDIRYFCSVPRTSQEIMDRIGVTNQSIQNMLRMIGLGEGIGSGFPLILKTASDKQWKCPELYEERELMQVKLILYIEPELQNVQKDVQKDVQKEITERKQNIIEIICANPNATLEEMSKRINISPKTIQRDYKNLTRQRNHFERRR